ncbi:MAG: flagellar hook assembly protein FlgD [Betaproteobacteria bacterium]|nr:flagellar hook assembly protein FlgD [Betaproteobacteria bacterium]
MTVSVASAQQSYAAMAAAYGEGAGASATTGSTKELSDRFLKLLVTQLRNQDPMNPMENAELTSQLAQMSTVEGIASLNSSMTGLTDLFRASQVLQGAALVGRQVMAEGNLLGLGAAGAVGGIELANRADDVKVRVLDANGATLRTLDLGDQEAGLARFVWDGRDDLGNVLAQGDYQFKVEASAAGKSVFAAPYSVGGVLSVSLNDDGMQVEISGLGMRGLAQIRQIY